MTHQGNWKQQLHPRYGCRVFPHFHQDTFGQLSFEDNQSCIAVATAEQFRPRTKHISCKYHFFRDHLGTTANIVPVKSSENLADIFTKPLACQKFEYLQCLLMGW
jgi:hypothetical protein